MRGIAALCALGLVLTAGPALARGADDDQSWGKPGVTLDQYRSDSIRCAFNGALSMAPAEVRAIDVSLPDVRVMQRLQMRAQDNARAVRLEVIAQCLEFRGYRRFDLTETQREQLQTLEHGSEERRVYLHGLASNPDILATQAH